MQGEWGGRSGDGGVEPLLARRDSDKQRERKKQIHKALFKSRASEEKDLCF